MEKGNAIAQCILRPTRPQARRTCLVSATNQQFRTGRNQYHAAGRSSVHDIAATLLRLPHAAIGLIIEKHPRNSKYIAYYNAPEQERATAMSATSIVNLVKFGGVVFDIIIRADRQTKTYSQTGSS